MLNETKMSKILIPLCLRTYGLVHVVQHKND